MYVLGAVLPGVPPAAVKAGRHMALAMNEAERALSGKRCFVAKRALGRAWDRYLGLMRERTVARLPSQDEGSRSLLMRLVRLRVAYRKTCGGEP